MLLHVWLSDIKKIISQHRLSQHSSLIKRFTHTAKCINHKAHVENNVLLVYHNTVYTYSEMY